MKQSGRHRLLAMEGVSHRDEKYRIDDVVGGILAVYYDDGW